MKKGKKFLYQKEVYRKEDTMEERNYLNGSEVWQQNLVDAYRIGVYMNGKCKMKIQNLQLIKGNYHGQYYGAEVL